MKKIINKKAFTIVELLAVIVIISILSALIVPNITRYMDKARDEYNDNVKKQMIIAGKNFYGDNKERIPTEKSIKVTDFVTLLELSSLNYTTKNFVDYDKNDCMDKSYVIAYNRGDGVKYNACMICGEKNYIETEEEIEYCKKYDDVSKYENISTCKIDQNSIEETTEGLGVKVTINNTQGQIDDFYKIENGVFDSFTNNSSYEIQGGIYDYTIFIPEFGNVKIYVKQNNAKVFCGEIQYNKSSNSDQIKATPYLVSKNNEKGFSKEELKNLTTYNKVQWTNQSIYVDLQYQSANFNSVQYKKASETTLTDVEVNPTKNVKYFFIEANRKNEGKITWQVIGQIKNEDPDKTATTSFNTKIDITKPTVKITGGGEWTNKDVTLNITANDALSGINKIEYSTDNENWKTLSGNELKYTENTNITVYVRAKDNAGNVSNIVKKTVKIDKTIPTVTVSSTEAAWTNIDVTASATASDSLSGIKKIEYSKDGSSWSDLTSSTSGSKKYSADSVYEYFYARALDNAGNYSGAEKVLIRIDKIPPKIYKHCFYQKTSTEWQFYYYISDSGGSGLAGFRWNYCYRICPGCHSSYMCSYKSAYDRMIASGWVNAYGSSWAKATHYKIRPASDATTVGTYTRMQVKDVAGNIYTASSDFADTWYYNGSFSPGRC